MQAGRHLTIPGSDATLVYREPLPKKTAENSSQYADLWTITQGDRSRAARVYLEEQAAWVLTPQPENDDERRRAAAQLATREVRDALRGADFFDHHEEFDVAITTFDDRVNQHGQLPWDPAATPLA